MDLKIEKSYSSNYKGNNPRDMRGGNKNYYDKNKKYPNNNNSQKNQEELAEIKECYDKIYQKLERYEQQNQEIQNDNKMKVKKVSELQKISYNQQMKMQKIKNSVRLALNVIEDTQESKEDAQQILEQNQICMNGDDIQNVQELIVYSVIYSQEEGKDNIKFLIGKKRKREYWFPDSRNNGCKQLYKNGFILKQVYNNQISFPSTKINARNESKDNECIEKAKQTLQHLFCVDVNVYSKSQAPLIQHNKQYSVVYFKVSVQELEKIQVHCQKIFKKVDQVIEEELKEDIYDDSLEGHSSSHKKLMKKYGWVLRNNGNWQFNNNGIPPSVSLDTAMSEVMIFDYEKDSEQINTWKKIHSGLDWYYAIVDHLMKLVKNPSLEADL